MNPDIKHIHNIVRHIKNVQDSCLLLGERLLERGHIDLGRELIANGMVHDHSKFFGLEFTILRQDNPDKTMLAAAMDQHRKTNNHHPERWTHIGLMPEPFLAECICDWKARSEEFGTDLREWIKTTASTKFGFIADECDTNYIRIMYYVNILLDTPFKKE